MVILMSDTNFKMVCKLAQFAIRRAKTEQVDGDGLFLGWLVISAILPLATLWLINVK